LAIPAGRVAALPDELAKICAEKEPGHSHPGWLAAEQYRKGADPSYSRSNRSGFGVAAFVVGATALVLLGWSGEEK
jgi:hypothetical protein